MTEKQTACVTVGTGTAVHRAFLWGDTWRVVCGAGGVGSAQIRPGISPLRHVAGPVTCRRCLAMAAKAERRAAP